MTTIPDRVTEPAPAVGAAAAIDWPNARAFIEAQFPVSRLSKESYKERKAGAGQTLTGLGKWWGRKPLVLVRAAILGLLLPATDDPKADRDTILALLTMDNEGLLRRRTKAIPPAAVHAHATARERAEWFDMVEGKPKWKKLPAEERRRAQELAFRRMGYDEKLTYCQRPEEIDGPSLEAWRRINRHLGTSAAALPELVRELGERRFGHTPRVGDAFCGGGSIPFEAARIGCDAYASDLSPVAALLTWAALNIVGGGPEVVERVQAAQRRVYEAVKQQIDEWGIERNEDGWIADAYLYCNEVVDPVSGWRVPLAPTWMVGNRLRAMVELIPNVETRSFEFVVHENASDEQLASARENGTWKGGISSPVRTDGTWLASSERQTSSLDLVRGSQGLRLWDRLDIASRPDDVLQERLYCIRWVNPTTGERHYAAPTSTDMVREQDAVRRLQDKLPEWMRAGYIPNQRIKPGDKTDELIRTRGWTYWYHLFNPRQLLIAGLFAEASMREAASSEEAVGLLLSLGRLVQWNSKLCSWNWAAAGGAAE
ncbi:MAG: DNA methylase, partial [Chloroflexi bacterium]